MKAARSDDGRIKPVSDYSEEEYRDILISRLFSNCLLSKSGCIEWQGCVIRGYGQIRVRKPKNKLFLTHRLSWSLKHGEIPEGIDVCHKCDNPKCINTDHLFLGTRSENMKDMVSKGRQGNTRGERSGMAKLDTQAVVEIKKLCLSGVTQAVVASRYGVHPAHVSRIFSNKRWSHL